MDTDARPLWVLIFSVIHAIMWVGLAIGVLALDVLELLGLKQVSWRSWTLNLPDSMVHGANMGPIWGRQDPGEPHVGPMNLAIRASMHK